MKSISSIISFSYTKKYDHERITQEKTLPFYIVSLANVEPSRGTCRRLAAACQSSAPKSQSPPARSLSHALPSSCGAGAARGPSTSCPRRAPCRCPACLCLCLRCCRCCSCPLPRAAPPRAAQAPARRPRD